MSQEAGRDIADGIEELEGEFAIEQGIYSCGATAISAERKRSDGKQPWEMLKGGSVLLVTSTPLRLWRVDIAPDRGIPCVLRILDKCKIGDSTTPACFFSERYYRERPIEDLIFLAAHTVLMAGAMNPAGVAGLGIVLCRPAGFTTVSDEEVSDLTARSKRLDSEIAAALFNRRGPQPDSNR